MTNRNLPTVSQQGANAGGDIVAGDKYTIVQGSRHGIVSELLGKLQEERERNIQVRSVVDTLARYHVQKAPDGIVGLEAKLQRAGREIELDAALEQKEQFAKLLEEWSLYASAQNIFAHLLARAEYEFNHFISPQVSVLDKIQVNELIREKVVVPTIEDCGSSVFALNHSTVMGMVYWLAEQCYVRWH